MHWIKILADTDKPLIIVMLWQITDKIKISNIKKKEKRNQQNVLYYLENKFVEINRYTLVLKFWTMLIN